MEILQGDSLFSYLYLKQTKISVFFFFSLFSSTKSENRRVEWDVGGLVPVERGRWLGKGVRG
jgi:hypothetical protein